MLLEKQTNGMAGSLSQPERGTCEWLHFAEVGVRGGCQREMTGMGLGGVPDIPHAGSTASVEVSASELIIHTYMQSHVLAE